MIKFITEFMKWDVFKYSQHGLGHSLKSSHEWLDETLRSNSILADV